MKSILISIHPRHCEKIASGKKTIEVRKTVPKIPTPFKCYIYMTRSGNNALEIVERNGNFYAYSVDYKMAGTVVGEFVCDKVEKFTVGSLGCDDIEVLACLTYKEMIDYFYKPEELDGKHAKFGYGWHISDLKIYDKPKELSEFRKPCDRFLDCFLCRRYIRDEFGGCDSRIHRPPQSWCYVEELK